MARARLAAILVVAAVLAACAPDRALESVRVLADIGAGHGPSTLKETTEPPTRSFVAFPVDGRVRFGDLYRPAEPAIAGLVLVPGAAEAGKDDPRLVAFANTLGRARFEVLVPEVPNMRALRVDSADAAILADAAIHMATRDPDRPLGMAAISFAVGPAVIALLEPDVADRVGFVVTVGGYYDLEAVITFFTTGHFRRGEEDPWRTRRPNAYGKWVFVLANASRLEDLDDRDTLTRIARCKLDDLDADVSELVARLGPEGRNVYRVLQNTDPERAPQLIEALPDGVRTEIKALDLSRRQLSTLETHFVIIHGRDDPIIPETESLALASALPDDRADLYVVDNLSHVDADVPGVADSITLLQAVYRVLAYRDGQWPSAR